ncbi:cysteine desulfurase family protein [Pedobacter rhizosphaerae]|uniref:Cysteine desulfurase n=1 Tax=Pedobacter rhizosphaerae TaxID=390241 RepID=A0A1H9U080_9SPHI|nr:cysteine desulfurase family protein [Pedobacter rhizosphaerae]SES02846.1 cysteine desulfurase [Pedobacter rhizosphaerae]
MNIYLDNAATTPLSREAFLEMEPFLFGSFGNPSSSHSLGRISRLALEKSRATIAGYLNAEPAQIIFTSGGTEADNTAIQSSIAAGVKRVITSALEHHAVLNTLKVAERENKIELVYLENDHKGNISITALDRLLQDEKPTLISLMHGNNEIGNLNPILDIADLAEHYGAIFHSDTVQTMGHIRYNTRLLGPDFLVGSAHKFHGPKGVGFLYAKDPGKVLPLISGGSQENRKRGGTENVAGIVGMAAALAKSYQHLDRHEAYILFLKERLINGLRDIPGIHFNGLSANLEQSLSTVLSISADQNDRDVDLLTLLDQEGICASGGSACSSGNPSHVIQALGGKAGQDTLRFSFSRYNTGSEIDRLLSVIQGLSTNTVLNRSLSA